MRTKFILSLLATVPSALAAVNGACSNGVKGICIDSGICGNYGGTSSSGNCPSDPNNVKCCSNIPCKANNMSGSCVFESECDGTTYSGLCPGGSNFKCCIRKSPGVGTGCSDQNITGTCIDTNTTPCSTTLVTGKCPGAANVKCCLSRNPPAPGVGTACSDQNISGTCIDTNNTPCSTTLVSGKCPGAANVKCCLSKKPPVPGVGTACSDQNISGTCIDTNNTPCSTTLVSGKCPGAANVKCCLSQKPPTTPSQPANGVGSKCADQGTTGTCIDTNSSNCSTLLVSGKCPGAANVKCCLDKIPDTQSICDISLTSTTLTRQQFISALQSYASGSSGGLQTLASNAGTIYDLSIQNSFNPEMVIIRAMSEGYSPGGSTNNYWGIACYNTGGSCASYASLSDGVLAYINNIKGNGYTSVYQMMLRYAYIGDYWYNPGSSSLGGCYYFPYIRKYMSTSRASSVESACNGAACSSSGGSGCVRTTDEDQSAYAQWQVSKMADNRAVVFNISC